MSDISRSLKIATVWLVLGLVVFTGVQYWQSQQARTRVVVQEGGAIEIKRSADGHFHWPAEVNGRRIEFLVDTGASTTALPDALARELDLPQLGTMQGRTAGGPVEGRVVRADVTLQGGIRAERLRVAALPALASPLLGMDVLGRMQWQQSAGVLRIQREGSP